MELFSSSEIPEPEGATVGQVAAFDGMVLRYARWRTTARRGKGTVCVFPGRGEFIEKYYEVVAELRARGFAVAVLDWRGQGGSGRALHNPRKGHVDDFEDYERDLRRYMEEIVLPDCPAPYFALAHSMGGNILLRAARLGDCWFDRMVLVSPMVKIIQDIHFPALTKKLAEILVFLGFGSLYVPGGSDAPMECQPFPGNYLTSDEGRLERMCAIVKAAPGLALGSPSIQWLYAAFQTISEIAEPEFPESVKVPMLLFGAGDDKIVSAKAIEQLGSEMRVGSFMLLPNARHEILMERDHIREQFWAAFDAFIPGSPAYR